MSATISKGRMYRVTTTVDDERLKAMHEATDLTAEAVQVGADYWHTGILPRHFEGSAHGKYQYAARAPKYLKNRGKAGKTDLVFSGSLRNDVLSRVAFRQAAAGSIELKMQARVLNLVPRMAENDPSSYVKHNGRRGYPNLKRELKAITDEEREAVASVTSAAIEKLFGPHEN